MIECDRCLSMDGQEEHTCPYKTEIEDDFTYTCNCCSSCVELCCDEI